MEKKQSSIDWLEWQINLGLSERGLISAFKEAKEMHKEEIIKANQNGQSYPFGQSAQYYSETFGGQDE